MNKFSYEFPVRIHFGQGCFEDALLKELPKYGETVMLAYGGGSLKRTGLYDRIVKILHEQGKTVVDFAGILASTDPVALDQACIDIINQQKVTAKNDPTDLLKRIDKQHGMHTIDHAAQIGYD